MCYARASSRVPTTPTGNAQHGKMDVIDVKKLKVSLRFNLEGVGVGC